MPTRESGSGSAAAGLRAVRVLPVAFLPWMRLKLGESR